ncbi:MAG: glycosyltransferase family 2 protein [Bacteroidaceae bacterium]|nr:glycosyltransferase family 2 protein [Bacteroidaceae bacterium]
MDDMNAVVLTVVVPVYNAERYLDRCLDSLVKQWNSHEGYEILCINDGSTDKSYEILLRYATMYPEYIRIINQENKGIIAARNRGIKEAKGEIIAFCDDDDFLKSGAYQYLYDQFWNDNIDVVSFYSITLDRYVLKKWKETTELYGEIVFQGTGREYYQRGRQMFVWNQLYRKEFLVKNNIEFTIPRYEDVQFNMDVYMHNPNVIVTNACLYRYTVNPEQTTKKRSACVYRIIVDSVLSLTDSIEKYKGQCGKDEEELKSNLDKIKDEMAVRCLIKGLGGMYLKYEYSTLMVKLQERAFLPIRHIGGKQAFLLNNIYKSYFSYKIASWLYRKVFVPYVIPRLAQN